MQPSLGKSTTRASDSVLLAGNSELSGWRIGALFLLGVFGGFAWMMVLLVLFTARGAKVPSDLLGVAIFAGVCTAIWLYVFFLRREVRLHPAARMLASGSGLAGRLRYERYPLSRFERVCIETSARSSKVRAYDVCFRGTKGSPLILIDRETDWNLVLKRAILAAGSTGLPLDDCARDRYSRLTPAEIAPHLARLDVLPESSPWWRDREAVSIVLLGLLPIFGVFFFGWSVLAVMLAFWMENVVIGVFTFLKILIAERDPHGKDGRASATSQVVMAFFFLFHYGAFCLGHACFIVLAAGATTFQKHGLVILPLLKELGAALVGPGMLFMLAGLAISYGIGFYRDFVKTGAYKRSQPDEEMGAPYGRLMILHVALLFVSGLVLALDAPKLGAVLLAGLKITFDFSMHRHARRSRLTVGMLALGKLLDANALRPEATRVGAST